MNQYPVPPIRKKRKYARYFDWHNKQRKELGILEELLKTMKLRHEDHYSSPEIANNDPPDCTLLDSTDDVVAVEIRELVSEDSVRKIEQGKLGYKFWNFEEVVREIYSILKEKDGKHYHGGPYHKLIVVIHTDENSLSYESYVLSLQNINFSGYKQVDEAYLLFSFNPSENCCPYVRLNVKKGSCS